LSSFDRLDPGLQFQIVGGLGFKELRPVQEMTIDAVLDGHNAVVLAPTAGGKTEAAFFPLLSKAISEDWAPLSILYVTPIKALLNNQEARLQKLSGMVGRRAFKWHGDVNDSWRKKFLADPSDILLTTPEALEGMLVSKKVPHREIFANLQAIVIDEVHAFAGVDRGAQLSCLLERLARVCGRDLQRLGLSATVGNPDEILSWVSGSSSRQGSLVDPPRSGGEPQVELDFVGSIANAAVVIEQLHRGKKRLVFCDSRRKVEELGHQLDQRGVRSFVMHSSLSVAERQLAEQEFEQGSNCVIVATSAMELGIDIGDLDHVLQVDCPPSVASFLQRMGRTGRRARTHANCTFLCTSDEDVLQAAGLLRLWREGYVEPVRAVRFGPHIIAQQLMTLTLQEGPLIESQLREWLGNAAPLAEIDTATWKDLLQHLLEETYLIRLEDGALMLGPLAEQTYGKRNFLDLLAVFEGTDDFMALHGTREIGYVSSLWVAQNGRTGEEFTLGGKAWRISDVDYSKRRLHVGPGEVGRAVGWRGLPRAMSFEHCQAMWQVLRGADKSSEWSERACDVIESARDQNASVPSDGFERREVGIVWHSFAGLGVNVILQAWLTRTVEKAVSADNLALSIMGVAPMSAGSEARPSLEKRDIEYAAGQLPSSMLGKFADAIPANQRLRALANHYLRAAEAHLLAEKCPAGFLPSD